MFTFRSCQFLLCSLFLAATSLSIAQDADFTSALPDESFHFDFPRVPAVFMSFVLPENFTESDGWSATIPGADIISRVDLENHLLLVVAVLPQGTDFLESSLLLDISGKPQYESGPVLLSGLQSVNRHLSIGRSHLEGVGLNVLLLTNSTRESIRILRVVDRPSEYGVVLRAAVLQNLPLFHDDQPTILRLLENKVRVVDQWDMGMELLPSESLLLVYNNDVPHGSLTVTQHAWIDYEHPDGRFSHSLYSSQGLAPGTSSWLY